MLDYEVGYTPTNLRLVIEKLGCTQLKAAEMCGVKERTLRQWLVKDLDAVGHRDMPLKKWNVLLDALNGVNNGK